MTALMDAPAAQDPRLDIAFPVLTPEQIASLEPFGGRAKFAPHETVWLAGSKDNCMYVVIDGELNIMDGRFEKLVTTHKKGAFSGDIDVLSGRAVLVSGVAGTDLELLEVPANCVRSIVGERPDIGEVILRAFLMRRVLLTEKHHVGPLVIGSRFSADTLRIREFLARNSYPVIWEDLEAKPETLKSLAEFGLTEEQTPVVLLPSGQLLLNPSNLDLAGALGISRPVDSKIYDLAVIGAGPGGLAAAVYGASEGLTTLLLDSDGPGGQAGTSSKIENYMGFPLGVSGQELAERGLTQAVKFGAQLLVPAEVTAVGCNAISGHDIEVTGTGKIECRCLILAPGAQYRKLELDGMEKYEGRGIYYAATHVERVLCGDSQVAVVGAGNSAGQAAIYMSEMSGHVHVVVRGDSLRKTMSSYLATRIEQNEKITVHVGSEICAIQGDQHLESATILHKESGEKVKADIEAIFVMIGAIPNTAWLPDSIAKDPKGFILTGRQVEQTGLWTLPRPPHYLETSCPGVFAVGDARSNSVKRVASAVGEGAMAVAFVHQFLAG